MVPRSFSASPLWLCVSTGAATVTKEERPASTALAVILQSLSSPCSSAFPRRSLKGSLQAVETPPVRLQKVREPPEKSYLESLPTVDALSNFYIHCRRVWIMLPRPSWKPLNGSVQDELQNVILPCQPANLQPSESGVTGLLLQDELLGRLWILLRASCEVQRA